MVRSLVSDCRVWFRAGAAPGLRIGGFPAVSRATVGRRFTRPSHSVKVVVFSANRCPTFRAWAPLFDVGSDALVVRRKGFGHRPHFNVQRRGCRARDFSKGSLCGPLQKQCLVSNGGPHSGPYPCNPSLPSRSFIIAVACSVTLLLGRLLVLPTGRGTLQPPNRWARHRLPGGGWAWRIV